MKKIASMVCALSLMLLVSVNAFAEVGEYSCIFDYADVIDDFEEGAIDTALVKEEEAGGIPIVILTKQGNPEYSASEYSQTFYENNSNIFQRDGGLTSGVIFTDDFDNNSFVIYPIGDAETIYDDATIETVGANINSFYSYDDMPTTYNRIAAEIGACNTSYLNGGEYNNPYGDDYDFSAPDSGGAILTDWAELFTDEQESDLVARALALIDKYNVDIVLHTTNSIGNKSIADYADDFFDYNGYGIGDDRSGLLFMLNMNNGEEGNRDYYTSTRGSMITMLTNYAIFDSDSYINSEVLPYLSDGDYYEAFCRYLELIDTFLLQATTGEPYDYGNPLMTAQDYIMGEIFVLIVAVVIAFVITRILKGKMKTAVIKREASDYLKHGSMVVTRSSDIFTHKSLTRTAKPKNNTSVGGSSSHSSSSGASHGGGGGKF